VDNTFSDYLVCLPTGSTSGLTEVDQYFSCSEDTKYYAGPGSLVNFELAPGGDFAGAYKVFISGYYVPTP